MRGVRLTMVAVLVSCFIGTAYGEIQLVSVPGRDQVELTIYTAHELTYAKERRRVALRPGSNILQFSWSGTRIDPTSIDLSFVDGGDSIEIGATVLPPGLENTILWQVESKDAVAPIMEVTYFIYGLTWSARYQAYVNDDETTMRLQGYFT
ncbi:MAG: hypothetical protein O3A46_17370, partial [Candidatus Poribacteria bacterium]|nr:hypothetical protein [Candidatus Poribacteria bacterium]